MRRWSVTLMAFSVVSMAIPASAQVTAEKLQKDKLQQERLQGHIAVTISSRDQQQATPEAVVARLMSFDLNHDGRVTRDELPERMQMLVARTDISKDASIDAYEVFRWAQRPPVVVAPTRGFEPGHYGFGEDGFGFDTRLHIEGAIEDLRLAAGKHDEALSIGRQYVDAVNAQAKADLLAAAEPLLTSEEFADLKTIIDQPAGKVALPRELVLPAGSNGDPEATLRVLMEKVTLMSQRTNLARVADKYSLDADGRGKLQAAIERFQAHDRLSDDDRATLLGRLQDILTDQEQEDLRAALERRPIVKQDGLTGATIRISKVGSPSEAQQIVVSF